MHTPVVELKKLRLMLVGGAGEVNILKGIDLTVTAGQTISVVGPSGSGKTTLLMVIAGLEKPTSGSVAVTGRDLGRMSEDALARFRRQHVGIVFQSFHLIPTMTALENAALPLEFAGVAGAREQAAQSLKSVGLDNRLAHYPSQLSGGEQQRVALARAVVNRPALLLADEPTGNLDLETGRAVMDLLFRLQEENGSTMILVTHDLGLAKRCCTPIRMVDGRFAAGEPVP